MFVCCTQLFLAGYGTAKVHQGLDLGEMVPRESSQYKFLTARQKYFSFYQIHVVTKGELNSKIFDYASNQLLLMEFYTRITKVWIVKFFYCIALLALYTSVIHAILVILNKTLMYY